jgi:hypothetical protein
MPAPAIDADPLAFRLGQVDALASALLASPSLYTPEMRGSLALRWLTRAWAQYRRDRAIDLGEALVGAECTSERNAFLALLEHALPADNVSNPVIGAIRLVRQIAVRPVTAEAAQTAAIVTGSTADLDAVLAALGEKSLPAAPLERLLTLVERFRYSRGDDEALTATARSPCWAINLAAATRSA